MNVHVFCQPCIQMFSQPVRFSWLVVWLAGLGLCVLEGENECASLFAMLEKKPVNSSSVLCFFFSLAHCWLCFHSQAEI